jgi:hypothetical protein
MKYPCFSTSSCAANTAPLMPSIAGVRMNCTPYRDSSLRRSTLMSSGIVSIRR